MGFDQATMEEESRIRDLGKHRFEAMRKEKGQECEKRSGGVVWEGI